MLEKNEKKVEVIFHNNIKTPSMQPFGRRKLMMFLSAVFIVNKFIAKFKKLIKQQ